MNLSFGLEVIYEDADFHIDAHDKAGIVGVNGAGKTTLFHALMHEQELDSGTVSTGHLRIGYLPQEIILEDESCTVLEYPQSGTADSKTGKRTEPDLPTVGKRRFIGARPTV